MSYSANEGDDNFESVGFHFWWRNSSLKPVLLSNIASHPVINGSFAVVADCDFLFPDRNSIELGSYAALDIHEFWKQPPDLAPGQGLARIAGLQIEGGLCETGDGNNETEYVFNKIFDLKHSDLEVPAKGTALFDVSMYAVTIIYGGPCGSTVKASIMCPFVQFEVRDAIQSGPPI